MATSRTGTAAWKSISARAIRAAQDAGLAHCPEPGCGVELDYDNRKAPNGATVDHVVAHANGGADHIDNTRVICGTCNSRKGKGKGPAMELPEANPFPWSRQW